MSSASILNSVKAKLGIESSTTAFDVNELIDYINTAFGVLQDLGVGPEAGFAITGTTETWNDFSSDPVISKLAPTYVHLYAKNIFDTPQNSSISACNEKTRQELELRMQIRSEILRATNH